MNSLLIVLPYNHHYTDKIPKMFAMFLIPNKNATKP